MPTTIRLILLGLVLTSAGNSTALSQAPPAGGLAPPSSKAVVIKGKAPVSDSILRVRLPLPREADLPNGLHLIVLEDRRVPQVTFNLIVPGAGGYFDPADLPGLGTFTAAMMREGTATRTSARLSEQLETIAATLNVSTGMSSLDASVSGYTLTEHVGTLFDLMADVLLYPAFPEDELVRYRQRMGAQLVQQRASPGFLAAEMFSRAVNGDHPASRLSPSTESLNRVTRADMVEFHRARYVPDHAALAIAGDISLAEARALVESRLGAWKKAGTPAPASSDPPAIGKARVYMVARPSSVQTNFVVGTQSIDRTDADYDALQVMNKVVGGGPTGRLFIHLREDKGYTYGAYSGVSAGKFRGTWQASTDVRSEVTEPALRDLMGEIAHIREQVVPEQELRNQKRSLIAAFALSLESPQQMLGYHITRWSYGLPADYWDNYPGRVMAITQAQVQAVAKKYLDPSRIQIVAVGDGPTIEPILRRFGEVDIFDTEGTPARTPLVP